jgi:hypothetical protein
MQAPFPQDAVKNYVKNYFENMAWLKYFGTLGCLMHHIYVTEDNKSLLKLEHARCR